MISLDSAEWHQLTHAYGTASDIPGLLQQLTSRFRPAESAEAEPWHALWSALCHQGDVYAASYAAMPHIVRIGLNAPGPIDMGFFLLPACVEVSRARGRGPQMPAVLARPYFESLPLIHESAFRHRANAWDKYMTRSVLAALAAAKGEIDLAEILTELDDSQVAAILDDGR